PLHDLRPNHRAIVEEGNAARLEPFAAKPGSTSSPTVIATKIEVLPELVETWLLVPVPAPDFALADLARKSVELNALRGKKVLLQFWTAESGDCLRSLQNLESRVARWRQSGLQVLAVNTDKPDAEAPPGMGIKTSFSFPLLRGTADVVGTYNLLFRYLFDR